jgi:hypothetical protein
MMAFGDHTRKFGKCSYNLLNTAKTMVEAKKLAKDAREYGFARVRIALNPKPLTSKFDNKYWIWVDGLQRKNRKNLWNPATAEWVK